jgi:hypothetical protein
MTMRHQGVEWPDTKDFKDPNYEPRTVFVRGKPGHWEFCQVQYYGEIAWLREELTDEIRAQANQEWARQFGSLRQAKEERSRKRLPHAA